MKRRTPLRRSGFKREPRQPKVYELHTPRPRATAVARTDAPARLCVPVPKPKTERSEPYLRLVAALPCCWCGAVGRSQAAHPNMGKGQGIKAPDNLAFPLCADQPGAIGCHTRLDQTGQLDKQRRRDFEELWGNQTRMKLRQLAESDRQVRAVLEKFIGM